MHLEAHSIGIDVGDGLDTMQPQDGGVRRAMRLARLYQNAYLGYAGNDLPKPRVVCELLKARIGLLSGHQQKSIRTCDG